MTSLVLFGLLSICLSSVISVPVGNGDSLASSKWIDLSYPFIENVTIYWPTIKHYKQQLVYRGPFPGKKDGIFVTYSRFEAGEHGGTHMDAPIHFYEKGQAVDEVPLGSTIGDAVVINISAKAKTDPDYQVRVIDLEEWEKEHGRIPNHSIVFLYTGYGKFWPNREKYFGTKTPMNTSTFHYPGIHIETAEWLVSKRNLKMYGLDVASLDYGRTSDFPVHVEFARHNIPGIENVANLHLLPPKGAEVFAAPMKMRNGSGGPCRLFARIVNKEVLVSGGSSPINLSFSIVISLLFLYNLFVF